MKLFVAIFVKAFAMAKKKKNKDPAKSCYILISTELYCACAPVDIVPLNFDLGTLG